MIDDFDRCYRFMQSRDTRYDGVFFVGVRSTGIYCRPSCAARVPNPGNVRLFDTAAAAQAAGLRACKRCEPNAAPGSPSWNRRADVAARALRLVAEGTVDRDGVPGLAARLHVSERHLHRTLVSEYGAGALALARAHRAEAARLLIQSSDRPMAEVAQAAGFGSVRQFNETVRGAFGRTPSELRARARRSPEPGDSAVELRLEHREPLDRAALLADLAAQAIGGVEQVDGTTYTRSLRLEHAGAVATLRLDADAVTCRLHLDDLRDLPSAVRCCRRLLDLDADPVAIADQLGADPVIGRLVRSRPGVRVAGGVGGLEIAVRAIVAEHVPGPGGAAALSALVQALGEPLARPRDGVTHRFPAGDALAGVERPDAPLPRSCARTVGAVARAVAGGELDLGGGADPAEAHVRLREIPGMRPSTAAMIALRSAGDPDAFPSDDEQVAAAVRKLSPGSGSADVERLSRQWRPWRAYAGAHLRASLRAT